MNLVKGYKIRLLREREGLIIDELAAKVGASHAMIDYIETGKRQPSVDLLTRIADYFGEPLDNLLYKTKQ
jgi:transcriptional regulator with XRE-family HTH domain